MACEVKSCRDMVIIARIYTHKHTQTYTYTYGYTNTYTHVHTHTNTHTHANARIPYARKYTTSAEVYPLCKLQNDI